MQRKYLILALLSALMLGTVIAALPRVESSERTDVWFTIQPQIITGAAGPTIVNVYIDAPNAWDNQPNGIVGWALSVRVDPVVIDVYLARKALPVQPTAGGAMPGGFLEAFLARHNYNTYDPFFGWTITYPTDFYVGEINATSGTMLDVSEFIRGTLPDGRGAGGGPYKLCELLLVTKSEDASVIDLFGPPRPEEIPPFTVNPQYMLADGTWHEGEVVENVDAYWQAETPDKMYFDMPAGFPGWEPPPLGSDWHELWPQLCNTWTLESHDDNEPESPGEPGVLDVSDQIDLIQIDGPDIGKVIWGHVDWINPEAEPGDGQADLIITVKPEVPEFPLGIGWIMTIALAIPVVYVWRRKRGK